MGHCDYFCGKHIRPIKGILSEIKKYDRQSVLSFSHV